MAVIDTLLTFGMGWLLGRGGPLAKKLESTPQKDAAKKDGSTPSKVPWPDSASPETRDAIREQEAFHAAEKTKFEAQLAEAKAAAGNDKAAQADIARRARERQKALDDWQRDIDAAKR